MRLNQYLAQRTNLSRRSADSAIQDGRVMVNDRRAKIGEAIAATDTVTIDGQPLGSATTHTTIMLNKPTGYVCSRRQQGSAPTIYALLPENLHHLKPIGRLDKDSSGLLLLTNDGQLAQRLGHPSEGKWKTYELVLSRKINDADVKRLEKGVELEDGPSRLEVVQTAPVLTVRLQEGRNRQIRRTLAALGYAVRKLHRTAFGPMKLGDLESGQHQTMEVPL